MSNQIVISSGAKVRALEGVLTGTAGIVNALGINVPNGIPQLDGSGKILVSQLPNSVMEYKGTWNAATNTPTLVNGTGNQGDVYLCNVAGTVDFGAGPIVFFVGDQVIYSGTIWQRASGASGTVTSVAVTESGDALTITGSPITTSGTINIGFAGTSGQYINGAGGLTTFPSLTGFVPYTGATANLDLGTFDLTTDIVNLNQLKAIGSGGLNIYSNSGTHIALMGGGGGAGTTFYGGIIGTTASFASNGGSNTFDINHSSGSGIALNITKGGNGEGLYINKTSGSGNAASITGGVTLLSELHLTTDLADAYIASAATWNAKQNAITLTTTGTSGAATLVGATLNIPQYQGVLTNPVTGTGLNGAIPKFTTTGSTIGSSIIFDSGTQIGINTLSPSFTLDVNGTARVNGVLTLSSTISNGTYTYTLPSATGTLALTSQIPSLSGYVQGTGNANYVALFNGTSSIGNSIIYQSGTNVGIMNASPTTTLDVTGGGQFSGSIIALSFIKSGGTSAQILAADGSVITAGTNITISGGTISTSGSGITGSGTTNYVTKFTGASSIGNSLIFDNGTNIGIGLTSPSYKLDVQDNGVSGIVDVASFSVTGNGGSGRGVGILLGAAGSSNSVQVARLVGYQELANPVAVAASFAIQVANSSGTLTERLRITQAGNLIIGTTTDGGFRLNVNGTGNFSSSLTVNGIYNVPSTSYFVGNAAYGYRFNNAADTLNLVVIKDNGNVGIGTSSPSKLLHLYNTAATDVMLVESTQVFSTIAFKSSTNSSTVTVGIDGAGNASFENKLSSGAMTFVTNGSERARITSGGNVLIGTTSAGTDFTRTAAATASANVMGLVSTDDSSGAGFIQFRNSATTSIGSITRVGTTNAVAYNTTSDYRLKEDLQEIKGLEKVSAIKVYDFKWKDNEFRMDGVLAHELQEVIPYAVKGQKDDKEMQSVDYSKIVPIMVKAIQELEARIKQLENK
jgi:hypothetical protein